MHINTLWVLPDNKIIEVEIRKKICKKYKRKIRKVLGVKLNGRNIIKAANTWAVPVLRYSDPFLK